MKIAFFPLFKDKEVLKDYIFRATWYLFPLKGYIDEIVFFTNLSSKISDFYVEKSEYLDSKIPEYLKEFKAVNVLTISNLEGSYLEDCDFVFVAKEDERNDLIKLKNTLNLKFEIVRIDHLSVQYADSFFLRFAEKIENLHSEYKKITKLQVDKLLSSLKSDKVYLFGTGPNFSYTENYDFSDGLVIACNSMVVNSEIIEKLNPKLFVIADPIFHAGPSSYAESFRSSFLKVLRSKNNPIVVPLRDYHIYSSYFPDDIVSRLIPIPFENPIDVNQTPKLDLLKEYTVTTTSNILTLFQLPLASTLGSEIYISGCDGRPLTHNNYFWSHNKSVQINDKMNDIQIAHPAFFNISYDDYYNKHIETLENWITNIEKLEKKVYNITPSYIPALQKRRSDLLIDKQLPSITCKLSIIIPLFRAEKFIEKAIASIVDSELQDYEIIIVDDFSDDNGFGLVKELSEKNKNIYVFQNFYNKGVSGARNTGIKLSRGEAICFLDADDFVFAGSLEKRINSLFENEKTKIVHSTVKFVDEFDTYLGVEVGVKRTVTFKDCAGNPTHFNTLMFKKEIVPYLRFDENLSNGEDWLAIANILRLGYSSAYVSDACSAYRIHEDSTVIKDFAAHEEKLKPVVEWLYSDVDEKQSVNIYKGPLSSLSKDEVLTRRRFGQFIMSLFKGNHQLVQNLLNKALIEYISNDKIDFLPSMRVPYVRVFSRHINIAKEIADSEKEKLKHTLLFVDKLVPKNFLSKSIREFFNINQNKSELITVQNANFLYQQNLFLEAKCIYEELMRRDSFYSYLSFNIKLCERRENNDF